MRNKLLVVWIFLLLSFGSAASFNIGFRFVLSGNLLPTVSLRYEHPSGHGVEVTTGIVLGGNSKFLLRGELGYTYRYKNVLLGIGRGITRHGINNLPIFDDHMKISYIMHLKNQMMFDVGGTLSLGTTGQGLALWGGINKHY